jgi:DNA-binding LacI/PurR family transcriptional regulator
MGGSANERTRDGLRARHYNAAIVLCGPLLGLDEPGVPVVAIEQSTVSHLPVVLWDEARAMELLLLHLAALGHQRIVWLGPETGALHADRGTRCAEVAWAHGLSAESCRFAPAGDVIAAARSAMTAHLQRPRTWTAVVCFNDRVAIGAQQAVQAAGLTIPGDVSVVGIDDIEAALATPALTTVNHRLRDMGRRAGELALELAAGRSPSRIHVLDPELVVRGSTGRART